MTRRALCIAVCAMALFPSTAARAEDRWFARDKALHFAASFGLAAGGYYGCSFGFEKTETRLVCAGGIALGFGFAKELYDLQTGGDASLKDLTWDAIGTATGLTAAWAFDRFVLKREPAAGQSDSREQVRGRVPGTTHPLAYASRLHRLAEPDFGSSDRHWGWRPAVQGGQQ